MGDVLSPPLPTAPPGEQVLRELVRRSITEVDPLRILLFGSRAKGTAAL